MTKYIAKLINVGIAKEATRGTAEATADFYLQTRAFELEDKPEYIDNDSMGCTIVDASDSFIEAKSSTGSIGANITAESFGLVLNSALGTVSSALHSGETVVYDHTFTIAETAQHQSLTVFYDSPNGDKKYANAMINSLEVAFERGKILDFSADVMAKAGESATITPTCNNETIFRPQDFSLKMASAVSGLTASSAIPVKSFSINISKNVVAENVLGSVTPVDFLNGLVQIEGELTLTMDSLTYEGYALAGTSRAMRIAIENADVTIGTSSHPKFTIDLSKVYFKETSKSSGAGDIVEQTLSFKAFYDKSTSKVIDSCVLTNLTASY